MLYKLWRQHGNGSGTNGSGGYLMTFWRDFPLQKITQAYVFREENIGGQLKLRAISRSSSRMTSSTRSRTIA